MAKNPIDTTALDAAIEKLLLELSETDPGVERYDRLVDQLERLYKIRTPIQEERKPVSRDSYVAAGAHILGLLIVLNFEKLNPITSKAFGMLVKPKL